MSGEINNREYRKQALKEIIAQLHQGKGVEEVKGHFEEVFGGVSAEEIAQAEQALIQGGLPVEEVQRLCDVHAAVFKGSIEEIHAAHDPSDIPGHPVHTLKAENRALEKLMDQIREDLALEDGAEKVAQGLETLAQLDSHYAKKENLLFPYMERYGITAPPKVMWGVDDEIRAQRKAAAQQVGKDPQWKKAVEALLVKVKEMIFKEENIMIPMLAENLTQEEWKRIAEETGELGYCLIDPPPVWNPREGGGQETAQAPQAQGGQVILPTGVLKVEELTRMLDMLPLDITFVDKDDTVKYFSQGAERVFPRTKAVIGRKVSNCHPPASVHIVEKLVEDFKAGRKEHEDFWIKMGDRYILIRYFAVRSEQGEYLGVLEVTQNIKPIQEITGEKRLVSDA